ncbi:unnamed protein product [Ambrosiozyma monospora]|uniref:Unnamed protein product n=1 Tax=Ambrosiozyma monospora TaxID=43982 RepID=A0A9W6YXE3_AMBMO|nr:unnamed protein product [Ambrosiozyma monospora]
MNTSNNPTLGDSAYADNPTNSAANNNNNNDSYNANNNSQNAATNEPGMNANSSNGYGKGGYGASTGNTPSGKGPYAENDPNYNNQNNLNSNDRDPNSTGDARNGGNWDSRHSSSSGDLSVMSKEKGVNDNEFGTAPPVNEGGKNYTVCVLCGLIAFGGFVFGWDTGTISGFVNMPNFQSRFGKIHHDTGVPFIPTVRTGLIVAVFNIGCAIGGVTIGRTSDFVGRKKCLTLSMLVYIVGIVVQISSGKHKWYQYMIGRIISGLGVGSVSVVCPMFISETAPTKMRGALVSMYQLMITLGIFLGYCTTYGTYHHYSDTKQWRIPLGLCFLWALFLMGALTVLPESPRYLLQKGRVEEASSSFSKTNQVSTDSPLTRHQIGMMQASIEEERIASASAGVWDMFKMKNMMLYRLVLVCGFG